MLSKTLSKCKVLDLYESAISHEQSHLERTSKKPNKKNQQKTADSSSSEESIHVIESPITKTHNKVATLEEKKISAKKKKKGKLL